MTAGWSRSSTPPSTPTWRPVAGSEERVEADALCLGYGFFPSVELLRLAGCDFAYDEDLGGPVVTVDEWQRTTQPGILAAGDGTGVAGSYVAIDQGRLAALGAALDLGALAPADAVRASGARSAGGCVRSNASPPRCAGCTASGQGIYELSTPETIVCRCEEVTSAQLDEAIEATDDVNVVKTLTRTAMGLCQGRNCQRHVAATIARRHGRPIAELPVATPRPPVRPVPIGAIADASLEDEGFFVAEVSAPSPAGGWLAAGELRKPLPASTDVLIVGGGLAGTALAYYLARAGVECVLVERAELNREASGTNAGSFHFQIAIHQLTALETGNVRRPPRDRGAAARRGGRGLEDARARARRSARDPHHRRPDGRRDPEELQLLHEKREIERGGRAGDTRPGGRRAATASLPTSPTTCSARPGARTRVTRTRCSPRRSSRCAPRRRAQSCAPMPG